ncbi:restriction endonuclease subunit S [Chryseobacterium sp. VAUSW3]|uniref:restriction endonuclease subunit S n=1 Tax=Chryseobacterium sp. VAUSW3 TaxID=2010998 RepID=UPI000B4DC9C6|nr:restriction endonuclease subunit S [Chryseobacterium sp. VAUSW3]OWR14328.1 hypothetical protein CDW55_08405 [Chryseobacterium sp. VAUSW3]
MSYRKLGDLVKFISNKNTDGNATILFGINIDKFFMPSVANIIGVDLKKYKVVKKYQFACNRMHVGRDERLPISMSTFDYDFIVSPAYDVFEVISSNVLPEYLMLWFRRKEFDRQCWFYTDADVRGGLHLEALKSIEIKVPSIEEQRQIVAQYQSIANKIKVNDQICEKLEATAQALYKHWFVDFEFPNEQGKPYKSSGGKMVWNDELGKEIPEGWQVGDLKSLKLDISDGNYSSKYPKSSDFKNKGVPFIRGTDFKNKIINSENLYYISENQHMELKKGHTKLGDILMATRGDIGKIAFVTNEYINCNINAQLVRINGGNLYSTFYLGCLFQSTDYRNEIQSSITGSALQQLPRTNLDATQILKPHIEIIKLFTKQFSSLHECFIYKSVENQKLTQLQSLLLSRLAVGEDVSV